MSSVSQNYRLATVGPWGVRWVLKRNCSLTPRQLLVVFGGLSGVSLSVAGFFWALGAPWVLPFTVLELTGLAVAFVWYARHAIDQESLWLGPDGLRVEWVIGGRSGGCLWARHTVRVRPQADRHALVELQAGGQTVQVGRFVRPDLRGLLAQEIRRALHGT